jgi:hypothetical protein
MSTGCVLGEARLQAQGVLAAAAFLGVAVAAACGGTTAGHGEPLRGDAGAESAASPSDGSGGDDSALNDVPPSDASSAADDAQGAAGSSSGEAPVDADTPRCPVESSAPLTARAARSSGYGGTTGDYEALYDVACRGVADCVAPCVAAGGTTASCSSGSDCIAAGLDGGSQCLPPTYWFNAAGALSDSGSTADAAELVLVATPYDDALLVSDFAIPVPDDAVIRGIAFDIRRNADSQSAVDQSVQVLRNGAPVGLEHRRVGAWPATLTYATYGGPTDTWGVAWTPVDLRASGFGISVAARYTAASGNDRAHVDSVHAIVYYTRACD